MENKEIDENIEEDEKLVNPKDLTCVVYKNEIGAKIIKICVINNKQTKLMDLESGKIFPFDKEAKVLDQKTSKDLYPDCHSKCSFKNNPILELAETYMRLKDSSTFSEGISIFLNYGFLGSELEGMYQKVENKRALKVNDVIEAQKAVNTVSKYLMADNAKADEGTNSITNF